MPGDSQREAVRRGVQEAFPGKAAASFQQLLLVVSAALSPLSLNELQYVFEAVQGIVNDCISVGETSVDTAACESYDSMCAERGPISSIRCLRGPASFITLRGLRMLMSMTPEVCR